MATSNEAKPDGGRLKGLASNVLLAVFTVALCLLALEVVLRVHGALENRGILTADTDLSEMPPEGEPAELGHLIRRSRHPRLVYELKPGISVHFLGRELTLNEQGFRGPALPEERSPDTFRIVGLGDSIMFGFGVGDGEYYLAVLEDRLEKERPGLDVEVLNTAVPGYNTVMEVASFEEKFLAYKPDLVIVEFVSNDVDLPNFLGVEAPVTSLTRLFLLDFLAERLGREDPDEGNDGGNDDDVVIPRGLSPLRGAQPAEVPEQYRGLAGWDAFETALRDLLRMADEHSFAVAATVLSPRISGRKMRMVRTAEELGIPVLWAGKALREYLEEHGIKGYLGSPLSLSATDGHPSVLGHAIAAESLARMLAAQQLLPPPSGPRP